MGAKGWSNLIQHPVLIAPDQYNSRTYLIPAFLHITGATLCIATQTAFLTAYFSTNIDKKASTKQDLMSCVHLTSVKESLQIHFKVAVKSFHEADDSLITFSGLLVYYGCKMNRQLPLALPYSNTKATNLS